MRYCQIIAEDLGNGQVRGGPNYGWGAKYFWNLPWFVPGKDPQKTHSSYLR